MSGYSIRADNHRTLPLTPIRALSSHTLSSAWSLHSIPFSPASTSGASAFWRTPPKQALWKPRFARIRPLDFSQYQLTRRFPSRRFSIWTLLIILSSSLLVLMFVRKNKAATEAEAVLSFHHLRPSLPDSSTKGTDPIRWLEENSNDNHAISQLGFHQFYNSGLRGKPRGAIISLVRNSELDGMLQSMRHLEQRWNHKYHYPWIFFNDEPFTKEFKSATRNLTSANCHYGVVPKEHWSLPDWIDEDRFINGLEYLGNIGVGKGWMVSYHHMCRWNSGFFYKHPLLKDFDWYWRVEPDVHFFCDINYDVFRFMRDNKMKYGFNMNILDDARSFPSLWTRTRAFAATHPDLIHPEADLHWLLDPQNNGEYNNCQFYSNFEIGSLNFWRGKENEAYFNWLDRAGGFYYERIGDAPVHTLSVAMFLPKREVWFFRDIGYQHDITHQCPRRREHNCSCESTSLDENFYKLVPLESSQRKPSDTCIRRWLGGKWLEKKKGWTMEGEKAFGGDGYHGYVLQGDE